MTLELHATPEEVMRAVEALQRIGEEIGLDQRSLFALSLVLEESASNIVNHALQRDASQQFSVTIEHTGAALSLELRDGGPSFDPTQREAKPQSEGGWGLQLVRRYADEIQYRREGGQNVLRLTKRLAGSPEMTS